MLGSTELALSTAEVHVDISPPLVPPAIYKTWAATCQAQALRQPQRWSDVPHVEPLTLPAISSLGTQGPAFSATHPASTSPGGQPS